MTTASRHSFRRQLTVRYTLSFALLLLILCAATGFSFYRSQIQTLDRNILLIAQSEADFATQNAHLHLHRTHDVLPDQAAYSLPRYVQITNLAGDLKVANHVLNPSPLVLIPALLASQTAQFVQIQINAQAYRVVYLPIRHQNQALSLQVASPLKPVYDSLWQLLSSLILVSIGSLGVAVYLGDRLSAQALQAVVQITELSRQINLQQLNQRIPEDSNSPRELYQLSQQLNAMLERLITPLKGALI